MQTINDTETLQKIQACALRLLARREHSRRELEQKLLLRRFPQEQVGIVIDALESKGWVSDVRFVKAYVEQLINRGFGELKIQAELKKRGIARELIAAAIPNDSEFWEQQLFKLWDRKFNLEVKKQLTASQIRFLQARGFTLQQIGAISKFCR